MPYRKRLRYCNTLRYIFAEKIDGILHFMRKFLQRILAFYNSVTLSVDYKYLEISRMPGTTFHLYISFWSSQIVTPSKIYWGLNEINIPFSLELLAHELKTKEDDICCQGSKNFIIWWTKSTKFCSGPPLDRLSTTVWPLSMIYGTLVVQQILFRSSKFFTVGGHVVLRKKTFFKPYDDASQITYQGSKKGSTCTGHHVNQLEKIDGPEQNWWTSNIQRILDQGHTIVGIESSNKKRSTKW